MKFSVKVFLAAILTVTISFSIGGYILISSLFHSALEREMRAAVGENKMLRFTFEAAISSVLEQGYLWDDTFYELSSRLAESTAERGTSIRVSNAHYETVYENSGFSSGTEIIENLEEDKRAYTVVNEEGRYFIQTACMVLPSSGDTVYLETFRDTTTLFSERKNQFGIYQKIMLVLILVNGVLISFISQWLTVPIRRLSRMTRRIAGGQFDKRVDMKSRDEIGLLAADFNNMAEEIQLKISELEDAARRQEDFVAGFAHELKTPLTSMIGYADMLRSKDMPEEERFLSAQYIFSEGKRLESLSRKLLELIVMKRKDFVRKPVSAKWLLESTGAFLLPVLYDGQISLSVSAEDKALVIEPDLMKTLLINLLDNARKALEGTGHISMTGKCEQGGYVIYIKDNGRGILPEDLPKITEAFYMADKSRSRKSGGAGLGLSLCAEIAALHGGRIEFHSEPDRGTIVMVILP